MASILIAAAFGNHLQAQSIAAGQYHTVALKSDGSVWVWGYNIDGQIGDGTTTQRNSAVQVLTSSGANFSGTGTSITIVAVAAGAYHSIALDNSGSGGTSGQVWAWGLNSSGQCGDGTTTLRKNPVKVLKSDGTNLNNIVAICTGAYHNLALDSTGSVWAWGLNSSGELGDGGTTQQNKAEKLTTLSGVSVKQLAAGSYHSLLLTTGGGVMSWGLNTNGELGQGNTSTYSTPTTVSALSSYVITALAGGAEHSVALDNSGGTSGHVWTWGYNSAGQLGNNSTTQSNSPVEVLNYSGGSGTYLAGVTAIEAGYTHSLALISGAVYSWGSNAAGELGDGTTVERNIPVQALNVGGATFLAAGNEDSLSLKTDGTLWVSGANNCGQLGDGVSVIDSNALPILAFSNPLMQISSGCGGHHNLARDSLNSVWSWGCNANGQLGDGTNNERAIPVSVGFSGLGSATITSVAANSSRSMALDSGNNVWSWGKNPVGDGTTNDRNQPVNLGNFSGSSIVAIAEGGSHSMALDNSGGTTGHVWAWGVNGFGALGINNYTQKNSPVEVKDPTGTTYLSGVSAISAGDLHSLALINGAVYAWGYNGYGQLGTGNTTTQLLPVAVTGFPNGTTIVSIYGGLDFSAAIDSNGHVWTWGSNNDGQCGNGATLTAQTTPVEVQTSSGNYLSNVVALHCGEYYCTALKSDGTVWAWGYNGSGELGTGTLTQQLYAVQVANVSGATAIGGGYYFSVALKQDGSVQSWGYDGTGGLGVQADYASPFAIPGFNALATVTAPTVSITAPSNNASIAMGSPTTFTASASESGGTIASVSYYVNSTLIGMSVTGSSYSISWTPPTYGNFTFTAIAADTNGHTSYLSAPVTVQVPLLDPNSNSTGLAEWWELKYFGQIGLSASSSPDNNGFSLLTDYQDGCDPTNYYSQPNGSGGALIVTPTLTISSGNNQNSAANTFTFQPMVVTVTNSNGGALLANAPVTYSVASGGGQVSLTSPGTTGTSVRAATGSQAPSTGQAQAYYLQPSGTNVTSTITASSGAQSVTFTANNTEAPPNTGLTMWLKADETNANGTSSVSTDATNPDGTPANNSNVNSWTDNCSTDTNGQFSVFQTGAARPTYQTNAINGKPALQFNGSQGLTTSTNIGLNAGLTMIVVGNTTTPTGAQMALYFGEPQQYQMGRGLGSVQSLQYFAGFSDDYSGGIVPNANIFSTQMATLAPIQGTSNFNLNFYMNGVLNNGSSNNPILATSLENVYAGVSVGYIPNWNLNWYGDIAEVLVYDHALNGTDMQQVGMYLADKYGLYSPYATWPVNHSPPYSTEVQWEINRNQWSEAQADSYVAFQATNSTMYTDGLLLWLRADDANAVVQDGSGNVTEWKDETGNFVVTGTSGSEPTYVASDLNGEPGLHFNGRQLLTSAAAMGPGLNQDMTIITVGAAEYSTVNYAIYLGSNATPGANRSFDYQNGSENFDGQYIDSIGAAAPMPNTFSIESASINASLTQVTFNQNGWQTGPENLTTYNGAVFQNLSLGITIGAAATGAYPWQGDIVEQLVYDHQLTNTQLAQVTEYLSDKYGLFANVGPLSFSPAAGLYTSSQSVSISSLVNDPNRVIRYTLDGSEPTINSPLYTGPITVSSSALVQAAQFLNGQLAGTIASAQYTLNGQSDLPVTPTSLTATSISGTETDLSWTATGMANYSEIAIYRSTNGGAYTLIATLDPTLTHYADLTVSPGTGTANTYSYEVGTLNTSGISSSSASNTVSDSPSTAFTITVTTPSGAGDIPLP